jgi:ABC-type histidine transport system ATPase subunit
MGQDSNNRKVVSLAESRRDRARRDAQRKQAETKSRLSAQFRKIPAWGVLIVLAAVIGAGLYVLQTGR